MLLSDLIRDWLKDHGDYYNEFMVESTGRIVANSELLWSIEVGYINNETNIINMKNTDLVYLNKSGYINALDPAMLDKFRDILNQLILKLHPAPNWSDKFLRKYGP